MDSGNLKHSYPFCWRSETPLIYKVRFSRRDELWSGFAIAQCYLHIWSAVSCRLRCASRPFDSIRSLYDHAGGPQLVRPGHCHQGSIARQQPAHVMGTLLRQGEAVPQLAQGARPVVRPSQQPFRSCVEEPLSICLEAPLSICLESTCFITSSRCGAYCLICPLKNPFRFVLKSHFRSSSESIRYLEWRKDSMSSCRVMTSIW